MLLYSVGDLARMLNVTPAQISQLFYGRHVRDDLAPVVAGRRIIGAEAIPTIAIALRRRGVKLDPAAVRRADGEVLGAEVETYPAESGSCESELVMMEQGGEL
jgi:hypothetical protein